MSLRNSAKKLPYSIRQSVKYIYGLIPVYIRYGKVFRDAYEFLQESQWWSKEKFEDYQMQQLDKLLKHAYENVPYYRRIFNERGLKPKDIKSIDDLRKLPYLTKDIIRENLSDLIAQNYPKSKICYVTTGGSTGIPLGLYWEKGVTEPKERAFIYRGWSWAGFDPGEKRVILCGYIINRFKGGKRQCWEYDPIEKALVLSSYNMSEEILSIYEKKINEFEPRVIQAYPSSLFILVNYLKNNKLSINNLICILTSSESLYPHQREIIEESLGAKIYDHYGNTEKNALIMQCEKKSYHIISEYGILELIGAEGNAVNKEDEIGEIIATGFNNYAMPFVRYKTEDIAVYSKQRCYCGRNYPVLKRIEGRIQEFFVDKTGSLITFIAHDYCLWNFKDKINAYQCVQSEPGKVLLNIDAKKSFSISEIESIKRTFLEFYSSFDIEINFVKNIPRDKSGKFRYLIQKLPMEF